MKEKDEFPEMELYEHYSFYVENCVDEDKGEIPLGFDEWKINQ
jgi:hypothetical protein